MLEDNAGLLAVYADAARALEAPRYLEVVRDVLRFIDGVLWDERAHLYRGSQDADEEYFKLPASERAQRQAPYVDPVLYAPWNSLAVLGLYRAAAALGDHAPASRAAEVATTLAERFVDAQGSVARYDAGQGPQLRGLLGDQVAVAAALLAGYQVTGQAGWLKEARSIWAWTTQHLSSPSGALVDHAATGGSEGALAVPFEPLPENGMAVVVALTLAAVTGEESFSTAARGVLSAQQPTAERLSAEGGSGVLFAGAYASALQRYLAPPFEVHLVATPQAGRALAWSALAAPPPPPVVAWVDPGDEQALAARGYPSSEQPTAYACYRWACHPPVHSPEDLSKTLARIREFARSALGVGSAGGAASPV
jgi:uncharacterized protein YyaL (SSP411 family)